VGVASGGTEMTKWEYADLRFDYGADVETMNLQICSARGNSYEDLYISLEKALAMMGDQGWELVATPLWWWFYFKRPMEE
jgi:hypothetical protein